MNAQDFQTIERELGLKLPEAYCGFQANRSASTLDTTTVSDDARFVIERTLEHRRGYGGAPAWPMDAMYVGDEDDACPYVLFCSTGRVVRSDHGNLSVEPLSAYSDFAGFVEALESQR